MAKRFTDTEIWHEDWFIVLPREYQIFWFWIKDKCDHAGIFKPNLSIFNRMFDCVVEHNKAIELFNSDRDKGDERVIVIENGRWFLPKFINFQYGGLRRNNAIHRSIIKILQDNLIDYEKYLVSDSECSADKSRIKIFHAYKKKCAYCDKQLYISNFVIDHIEPKINGGGNDLSNLALSCYECNMMKNADSLEFFCTRNGFDVEKIKQKIERVIKDLYPPFKGGKDKDKDKEKDKEECREGKESVRFAKPSFEDVRAYCVERRNYVDPIKFWNHYESNGWKVGKNPMKNWKAAVHKWEDGKFRPKKEIIPRFEEPSEEDRKRLSSLMRQTVESMK